MNILREIAERTKHRVEEKKKGLPLEFLIQCLDKEPERGFDRLSGRGAELGFDRHSGRGAEHGSARLSGQDLVEAVGADTEASGFPFERALARPKGILRKKDSNELNGNEQNSNEQNGINVINDFEDISFICEVKRASPSKGLIAEDFPYIEIARDYEAAGAAAISVLTEPHYFKGDDRYLRDIADAVSLPLLRKDFTVDIYMIYEAKMLGADAVLLICSILDQETLAEYIRTAHSIGMSALVEVHNEPELKMALGAGARIIGVNNRDLNTFQVDVSVSARLRKLVPADIIFVSESGVSTAGDIEALRQNGVDAVLVGEALMRSSDKRAALAELRVNSRRMRPDGEGSSNEQS